MNVSFQMYAQKEISIQRNLYEIEPAFDPALDASGSYVHIPIQQP
jgi:hypothetical protein